MIAPRRAGVLAGSFVPMVKDMAAMFAWFDSGRYVVDARRQAHPPPTAEEAIS